MFEARAEMEEARILVIIMFLCGLALGFVFGMMCNRDKADIRTFENNRAGQTDGTIKR